MLRSQRQVPELVFELGAGRGQKQAEDGLKEL